MLVRFPLTLLTIAMLSAQAAFAGPSITVNCDYAFKALTAGNVPVNAVTPPPAPAAPSYPAKNVWTLPAELSSKQQEALARLNVLEDVKASSIFPDTVSAYDVTKVGRNEATDSAFYKKFDEIWDTRVKAGLVPKWELNRYRRWLRQLNPSVGPYPVIDTGELYTKFVKHDRNISSYFDEKFLEFIEKEKGLNQFASVDDYFKQLDRNYAKYRIGQTWRGTKALGRKSWSNMWVIFNPATIVTGALIGYQTEVANKISGYFVGTAKDAVNNSVATGLENAYNAVTGFANADEVEKAIDTVNRATEDLTKLNLDKAEERSQSVMAINQIRDKYDVIMPNFRKLIEANKKDYETDRGGRLEKMSGHNRDYATFYEQSRRDLAQLERDMAAEKTRLAAALADPKASAADRTPQRNEFEDMAEMADLRQNMASNEERLAKYLAKYLIYSSVRGKANVSDEISGQYDMLLDNYLRKNSLQTLRKAWLDEVNEHTTMIKSFMPKPPEKIKSEKALEEKKAADEAAEKAKQVQTKAEVTADTAAKVSAEKGEAAAKELSKEAIKLKEEAEKAAAEAKAKAEAAKKSAEEAKVDPTAKVEKKGEEADAKSVLPIPLPLPIPAILKAPKAP